MYRRFPRISFERKIKKLTDDLSKIGDLTVDTVEKSINSYLNCDRQLAKEIEESRDIMNNMVYNIENEGMSIIASEQPVAKDLLYIETCIKVSSHMNRINGLAVNIANVVDKYECALSDKKLFTKVEKMGKTVQKMIRIGFKAFFEHDLDSARQLADLDDRVDDIFDEIISDVSKSILENRSSISQLISLVFVARFLERMADRAENVGNRTIFMVTHERPPFH